MKKYYLVLLGIILFLLLCGVVAFLDFKNSYRFVRFKHQITMKNKSAEACEYINFEKLIENRIARNIRQDMLIDEAEGREHDTSTDILTWKMFENSKEAMIKNEKLQCEREMTETTPFNKDFSDWEIFKASFLNVHEISDIIVTVKKEKNKVNLYFNFKDDDNFTITQYEKINNKWCITDIVN